MFLQRGKDVVHVLVRVPENDDHRKSASRIDQLAGLDSMSSKKASHRMDCARGIYTLAPRQSRFSICNGGWCR
jgi:hypothetical protein